MSGVEYGDDVEIWPEINASAAATPRELTDEERAELEEREKRRIPLGFRAPHADDLEAA